MFDRRHLLKGTLAAALLQAVPGRAHDTKVGAPFPIYDSHPHFYSNDTDKYPFQSAIAERTLERAASNPMKPETVLRFWDQAGIMMGTGVQYNSTYGTDNRYLLDVSAAQPARIVPVVILSPTDPKTSDTLRKLAGENNIAGVRFTGRSENGEFPFLSAAAMPAWEAIEELGIVAVLMPVGGDPDFAMSRVHDFAVRFPAARIVLDHIGFPDPATYPDTFGLAPMHHALAAHGNVYCKFTSYLMQLTLDPSGTDLKAFLDYTIGLYGADRMIWGSDFGNTEGDHLTYLKRALDATEHMPFGVRRAFFFDTAYRLFVPGGAARKTSG